MKKYLPLLFLIVFGGGSVVFRLLPHPPNFAPISALALFAGVYCASISRWWLFLPLGAMFFSDLVIGFYDWRIMGSVYGSFGAIGLIGLMVQKYKNAGSIILGSLGASLLFYLTTNFAVWAFSGMYPLTLEGVFLSYLMGVPFFKFTLLGDLFFTLLFFGTYELARVWLTRPEETAVLKRKMSTV